VIVKRDSILAVCGAPAGVDPKNLPPVVGALMSSPNPEFAKPRGSPAKRFRRVHKKSPFNAGHRLAPFLVLRIGFCALSVGHAERRVPGCVALHLEFGMRTFRIARNESTTARRP